MASNYYIQQPARNWLEIYKDDIESGRAIVNSHVKTILKILLQGIKDGVYILDLEKANKAINFIQKYIKHEQGKRGPLILETWQKAIITAIFGILDPDTGRRQFKEVVLIIGRKMGKSLLAGAIIDYVAYCDGEHGAEIYSIAPELDQGAKSFNAALYSVDSSPVLSSMMKKRKTDYYIEETNTRLKIKAFNEKKSDGFNPHLTICDEISSWQAVRGLRQYEVIQSGTTARKQPLTISISSGGYVNGGIYDELITRSLKVLNGQSKERRLLPFIYQIEDVEKWDDINELKKALPNLGVSVEVQTIKDLITTAKESPSAKVEFLAKYCNLKQQSVQSWLTAETVKKMTGAEIPLEAMRRRYGCIGLDMSQNRDLTAAAAVWQEHGEYFIICHFWLPGATIEEAETRDDVPYRILAEKGLITLTEGHLITAADVLPWIQKITQEFEFFPLVVGYDRYHADEIVKDLKNLGLTCYDVWQGNILYSSIKTVEGLAKDGKLHIGTNELLKAHFLSCALSMSKRHNGGGKLEKLDQKDHIDGVAAVIDCFVVFEKWASTYGAYFQNPQIKKGE